MDTDQSDVYEKLMALAIRFVSYRPRSEKEIRDYLAQKLLRSHTTAPLVLSHVLIRLRELHYINDQEFSIWWVGQRTGRKPKGSRMIRVELARKGIAPEIIDEAVYEGMRGEQSEVNLAKRVVSKKRDAWKYLPLSEQKRKLVDYLLRRGFSSEISWGVVDDILTNV